MSESSGAAAFRARARYWPEGEAAAAPVEVSLGQPGTVAPQPARGGRPVELFVAGLRPGEPVLVQLGAHERERVADDEGTARTLDAEVLLATAGRVGLRVERATGEALELAVDVLPTRLAEAALLALLDDLDRLSPGLCADLGGHGTVSLSTSPPAEATLQALERAVGPLEEAVGRAGRRPIVRTWEEVGAVAAVQGVASARDARWLATHPHLAIPARARGQDVAVHRRVHQDLEVPENRGVALLLARLESLGASLLALVEVERRRLLVTRPLREAFRTARSNLFEERDRPRLQQLERRSERVASILGQVSAARARLGFPPGLRPAPFLRTPQVETHPGYWQLHQIWQQVADLDLLRPGPAVAPLRNTDELYELWCTLVVARGLARLARRPLHELVGPALEGWFSELPRGRLLTVALKGWELHLSYEPVLAYDAADDASLAKLHPGRPWRPDLLLEVYAAGRLIEAHVFDAKHSLDRGRPGGVPVDHVEQVWLKYPDSIGDPRTHLPRVASCWVLYPGPAAWVYLRGPAMLDQGWPAERVRGGAIALTPGIADTEAELERVLDILLRR